MSLSQSIDDYEPKVSITQKIRDHPTLTGDAVIQVLEQGDIEVHDPSNGYARVTGKATVETQWCQDQELELALHLSTDSLPNPQINRLEVRE